MMDPQDFIEGARKAQEAVNALGAGKPAIDPELAARITAAKAALTDYRREVATWMAEGNHDWRPDFGSWAERFAADLTGLIAWIEGQL